MTYRISCDETNRTEIIHHNRLSQNTPDMPPDHIRTENPGTDELLPDNVPHHQISYDSDSSDEEDTNIPNRSNPLHDRLPRFIEGAIPWHVVNT